MAADLPRGSGALEGLDGVDFRGFDAQIKAIVLASCTLQDSYFMACLRGLNVFARGKQRSLGGSFYFFN